MALVVIFVTAIVAFGTHRWLKNMRHTGQIGGFPYVLLRVMTAVVALGIMFISFVSFATG